MIDYKNYLERKSKGNAEIVLAGGGFAIATKKFDVETGEPTSPEITSISLESLEKEKLDLQNKIGDIDAVILELNNLTICIQTNQNHK